MNTRTEIISLVRNNPVKSISFFRIEDYKRYRELKQSTIIASQQICKDLAVNCTRTLPISFFHEVNKSRTMDLVYEF